MESVSTVMQSFLNQSRPVSQGETSWEDGDTSEIIRVDPNTGLKINKHSVITQANTIPIKVLLSEFGQHIDDYNRKVRCPFHAGGNERTPSFWVYIETNSFHCFGCKVSGKPVDFIKLKQNLNAFDAALFIIEKWGEYFDDVQQILSTAESTYINNDNLYFKFSDMIREFIHKNNDPESLNFAENICHSFDKMNKKHNLKKEALEKLIDKVKIRLGNF